MPFGLANAPAMLQRLDDALFGPEYEPYVFCYLDDIIVVTETFDEHLRWLEIDRFFTFKYLKLLLSYMPSFTFPLPGFKK